MLSNTSTLPPKILQSTRTTLNQLKNTIFEVQNILSPEPIFNLGEIFIENLQNVDFNTVQSPKSDQDQVYDGEQSGIASYDITNAQSTQKGRIGPQKQENHADNTPTSLVNSPKAQIESDNSKEGTFGGIRVREISQHVIQNVRDAIVIVMTIEQLGVILGSEFYPQWYLPNSLIPINGEILGDLFFGGGKIKGNFFEFYQSIHHQLQGQINDIYNFGPQQSFEIENNNNHKNNIKSNNRMTFYLYCCHLPPNNSHHSSQISQFLSLQPPLLLKNIHNSYILQLTMIVDKGKNECKIEHKIEHEIERKNLFSFASATMTNISNCSISIPFIDSSLHVTTMSNSVVVGNCHQLRLHYVTHCLFGISKMSILKQFFTNFGQFGQFEQFEQNLTNFNNFSHFAQICSDEIESKSNLINNKENVKTLKNKIKIENNLLEPIIENSQHVMFTPYPLSTLMIESQNLLLLLNGNCNNVIDPRSLSENTQNQEKIEKYEKYKQYEKLEGNLKKYRQESLIIFDFDALLQHQDDNNPFPMMVNVALKENNMDNSCDKDINPYGTENEHNSPQLKEKYPKKTTDGTEQIDQNQIQKKSTNSTNSTLSVHYSYLDEFRPHNHGNDDSLVALPSILSLLYSATVVSHIISETGE
jgi:hypothetical protein